MEFLTFILSSCITDNQIFNMSNTTDVTIGAGTYYPSRAPESPPVFSGIRVTQSLVFCVVFSEPLFVLFSLGHCIVCHFSIMFSLIYPFTIFKLFLVGLGLEGCCYFSKTQF